MIKVLDKSVSDKIAAGEVIERPVSIIKELIENSIDAGADAITCEIKNGGKAYIRVSDNGSGIPREEVETAFMRHATSKIVSDTDLLSIGTLGFRGEALASIAAVTRLVMITKPADAKVGCKISIDGGEMTANEGMGCPEGTTVIIQDLFFNTPARREFLKSDSAEAGEIASFLSEIAIAYSHIRFRFINNSKVVFSTSGKGSLKEAIISTYHKKEYEDLVEIRKDNGAVSVTGAISRPSLSRPTRREQIFAVNGRVVSSSVIEKGVSEGYRERLFEGRYPVVFLLITLSPDALDVNIHPNKKEVRFHDEGPVIEVVASAIREGLASTDAVIKPGDYFKEPGLENDKKTEQVDVKQILLNRDRTEPVAPHIESTEVHEEINALKPEPAIERTLDSGDFDLAPSSRPFDFADLRPTGCIFDTYITCEDGESFYLIDQHAAHERIFYEKLVGAYLSGEKFSQTLIAPLTVDIDPSEAESQEEWMEELTMMGYSIEPFGPSTVIVKEIPTHMELSEAEDFVKDFVSGYSEGALKNNKVVIDKLITRSCKSAVKAHDHLSMDEMEALISDLSACRNPFSCPHGRPTCIKFTKYEIEKFFKRIQ